MNEKDSRVNDAALVRYCEAIGTLAGWFHEVTNPEISEGEQAVLITCCGAGLEIAAILTGASVEEVMADVRSAYRKCCQKEESGHTRHLTTDGRLQHER